MMMDSDLEKEVPSQEYDIDLPTDDFGRSHELPEAQFLGSLMPTPRHRSAEMFRISTLHNQITAEATRFDTRTQNNRRVMGQLSEFYPYKWLVEITAALQRVDSNMLAIRSREDRVYSYLGLIELYLSFRGLTILDSTLLDINCSLGVSCTKYGIRSWKLKFLRIVPTLRKQWVKIRERTHQSAIFTTVVHIMNTELVLSSCADSEVFHVKQTALRIAKNFATNKKARHIKNPEVWARAVCLKALRDVLPNHLHFPFPLLSKKALKNLENKRWQLDQLPELEDV
jgi:hypothetical protein